MNAPEGHAALTQMNRVYRFITGAEAYLSWELREDSYYWYAFTGGVVKRGYQAAVAHMAKLIDDARADRRTATCDSALANDHLPAGNPARTMARHSDCLGWVPPVLAAPVPCQCSCHAKYRMTYSEAVHRTNYRISQV